MRPWMQTGARDTVETRGHRLNHGSPCMSGELRVHGQTAINRNECPMKRLHVHVSVADLATSIRFYKTLFGAEPSVTKEDYAKWMLEDPKVNFAISTRRQPIGINHLGFQVESDEELHAMRGQLEAADAKMIEEREQPCCYARSDKYWVTDPSGIAWETFRTLGSIPVYGEDTAIFDHGTSITSAAAPAETCCVPRKPEPQASCC
jgi:catechol 2,3-dioxygenase-like lactoylglutathione lyase family enzyme